MLDIATRIRTLYLDRLDENDWHRDDPNLDFGLEALPYFVTAFKVESIPARRATLVNVIWEFRDPAALPTLAEALRDDNDEVWKESLDGIVCIAGKHARLILEQARSKYSDQPSEQNRLEWIEEALDQVIEKLNAKAAE